MRDLLIELYNAGTFIEWAVTTHRGYFCGRVTEVRGDLVQFAVFNADGDEQGRPWVRIKNVCWIDPDDMRVKRIQLNVMARRAEELEDDDGTAVGTGDQSVG